MNDYVRPSTLADVEYIAERMRPADVIEVEALGSTPRASLLNGLEKGICLTALSPEGEPGAMLGVAPREPKIGIIWLLGTPLIEQYPATFLRQSKIILDGLHRDTDCDLLYNYTHLDNEVHHKWLRWLGFRFFRKVALPPSNQEFYEVAHLRIN